MFHLQQSLSKEIKEKKKKQTTNESHKKDILLQQKQEDLMDAAWRQIGDVLEAQRRIRIGQLIKEVSSSWHMRTLTPILAMDPERAFTIAAPPR